MIGKKINKFIKIDDDGIEHLVAIIEPNRIQIRLKEIRQFLAIKDMYLSIQFDCRVNSINSLKELGLNEGGSDQRDGLICWGHHYGELSGISSYRAFSRLLEKRLFAPLPKSKSGFWGFAEEPKKKEVEFIISVDEDGEEVTYTSDPDALANYFGANPDAPHYLTPVHFRKQVLDKYYQQPGKYSVEDSILGCGYLWSMQLDNHHAEKVCAWLGDLGRDLPYEEQLHWRAYNIPPEGGVSQTYFKRQILAQFADSDTPEHLFRRRYFELKKICEEQLGWQLLLPLSDGDEHYFKSIRIPATDEQKVFDELILGLSKTLIDSLNEKSLNKLISSEQRADIKGSIALLEVVLSSCGVEDAEKHTSFLRKLQNLRSSSSAHRKGSNYEKIAQDLGIDSQNLRTVFTGILEKALAVLDFYITVIQNGKLKVK